MDKVLIVVDYQNDFVDGSLGFPNAINIKSEIIRLINLFRKENQEVIFTKDTHYENYMETVEGENLPVLHCIKGSEGHEIVKEVNDLVEGSIVFEKESFPSLDLGNYLKNLNPKQIYLCGLVSDICVFSNAIIAKAACPNSEIFIIKNASDSYDKEMEAKAYDVIRHLHIKVIEA